MRRLATIAAVFAVGACHAATLYVSPRGNDAWAGTKAQPKATLEAARDAIRADRASGKAEASRIVLTSGTYRITKPIVLGPQDGNVTWEAAPGAKPIVSGGRVISGWTKGANAVWTASVPDVAKGKWYFEQLWINGARATRARTPNDWYSFVRTPVSFAFDKYNDKIHGVSGPFFAPQPEDLALLKTLSAKELEDVVVVSYHAWDTGLLHVLGLGNDGIVRLTGAPFVGLGPIDKHRYHIENLPSALDAPGEFFLARNGVLSYIPRPGEDMTTAEVIAPVSDGLLTIAGSAATPVRNIQFSGIAFRHSQFITPPLIQTRQAASSTGAEIQIDFARDVRFDKCEISHFGKHGIWFRSGCEDGAITQTLIEDTGCGAVRIGTEETASPTSSPAEAAGRSRRMRVDNCILRSTGMIQAGACAIWMNNVEDGSVTRNEIGDTTYTGISSGWIWGYDPILPTSVRIAYNHIHHIGDRRLSDLGAVYTLGNSRGTVVENNWIHDVRGYNRYGWGAHGLYSDEGTTGIVYRGNVVHDCDTCGYHLHYAIDNLLEDNLFAFADQGVIWRTRVEDHRQMSFQRNIVVANDKPMFGGNWPAPLNVSDGNLYWDASGKPANFGKRSLEDRRKSGSDVNSLVTDPLFENVAVRDFRLKPNSPARNLGIKFNENWRDTGVYGSKEWKALAATYPYKDARTPPLWQGYVPIEVRTDFEGAVPGCFAFDGPIVQPRQDVYACLQLATERARSGKHSLAFLDDAGYKFDWLPAIVLHPMHTAGTTTVKFSVFLEPKSRFWMEWRDWKSEPNDATRYAGPSLRIANGRLRVGDKDLSSIPTNKWVAIEMSAAIGKTGGVWNVTVTPDGGAPTTFERLPMGDQRFADLTWLIISSEAEEKSRFFLDDLAVTNTAIDQA